MVKYTLGFRRSLRRSCEESPNVDDSRGCRFAGRSVTRFRGSTVVMVWGEDCQRRDNGSASRQKPGRWLPHGNDNPWRRESLLFCLQPQTAKSHARSHLRQATWASCTARTAVVRVPRAILWVSPLPPKILGNGECCVSEVFRKDDRSESRHSPHLNLAGGGYFLSFLSKTSIMDWLEKRDK